MYNYRYHYIFILFHHILVIPEPAHDCKMPSTLAKQCHVCHADMMNASSKPLSFYRYSRLIISMMNIKPIHIFK